MGLVSRLILWTVAIPIIAALSPLIAIGFFVFVLPLVIFVAAALSVAAFAYSIWTQYSLQAEQDSKDATKHASQLSSASYVPTVFDCPDNTCTKVEVLLTPETTAHKTPLTASNLSSANEVEISSLSRSSSVLSVARSHSTSLLSNYTSSITPSSSVADLCSSLSASNDEFFGSGSGSGSDTPPPKHVSPIRRISLVRRADGRFSRTIHLPPGAYTCQYLFDDCPRQQTRLFIADPLIPLPASEWLYPTLDIKVFLGHLLAGGSFDPSDVCRVIQLASALLTNESCLLRVTGSKIYICGDLHGNLDAFRKLLTIVGSPMHDQTHVIFLGDYVDRGRHSMEIVLGVCCLKIAYPTQIHLLRGNHECTYMSIANNLYDRIKNAQVMEAIRNWFPTLPLAAVANNRFFCVHGGLSPTLKSLHQIEQLDRKLLEIPTRGLLCDLLWSDVYDTTRPDWSNVEFMDNRERGCAFYYGYNPTQQFLADNGLTSIIRAHEHPTKERKEIILYHETTGFPLVLTIYSSSEASRPHSAFGLIEKNHIRTFTRKGTSLHKFDIPKKVNKQEHTLPHNPEN